MCSSLYSNRLARHVQRARKNQTFPMPPVQSRSTHRITRFAGKARANGKKNWKTVARFRAAWRRSWRPACDSRRGRRSRELAGHGCGFGRAGGGLGRGRFVLDRPLVRDMPGRGRRLLPHHGRNHQQVAGAQAAIQGAVHRHDGARRDAKPLGDGRQTLAIAHAVRAPAAALGRRDGLQRGLQLRAGVFGNTQLPAGGGDVPEQGRVQVPELGHRAFGQVGEQQQVGGGGDLEGCRRPERDRRPGPPARRPWRSWR